MGLLSDNSELLPFLMFLLFCPMTLIKFTWPLYPPLFKLPPQRGRCLSTFMLTLSPVFTWLLLCFFLVFSYCLACAPLCVLGNSVVDVCSSFPVFWFMLIRSLPYRLPWAVSIRGVRASLIRSTRPVFVMSPSNGSPVSLPVAVGPLRLVGNGCLGGQSWLWASSDGHGLPQSRVPRWVFARSHVWLLGFLMGWGPPERSMARPISERIVPILAGCVQLVSGSGTASSTCAVYIFPKICIYVLWKNCSLFI